jgi:hypothetical protein
MPAIIFSFFDTLLSLTPLMLTPFRFRFSFAAFDADAFAFASISFHISFFACID